MTKVIFGLVSPHHLSSYLYYSMAVCSCLIEWSSSVSKVTTMTKEKRKPTKAAEEFEARPHMLWTHKKRVSPTSTTTLAYILSLALGEMGGRDGF